MLLAGAPLSDRREGHFTTVALFTKNDNPHNEENIIQTGDILKHPQNWQGQEKQVWETVSDLRRLKRHDN